MHKEAAIFECVRSVKVNRGQKDLGMRLNFEIRSEEDPGKEVTLTRAPAYTGENPGRWKSLWNFLTLYWRIKMLSSALRVGFSRVSMAAKRYLVPTINAGNFVLVLDHTFHSSRTLVHVELTVRGYWGYMQIFKLFKTGLTVLWTCVPKLSLYRMWIVICKYSFVQQGWLEHVSVRRSRKYMYDNHTASPTPSVITREK